MIKEKSAIVNGKNNKISFLHFVMTISIVLHHWHNFFQLNVVYPYNASKVVDCLTNFECMFGGIALSYFFMMSGFLFYKGMIDYNKCIEKIKNRIFSLIIPFITWNFLKLLYDIAYCVYKGKPMGLSVLMILGGFSISPFDAPLWYMFALILLLPFSFIVLKFKNNTKICMIVFFVISLISFAEVYFNFLSGNEILSWFHRLTGYLPCYAFGALLGIIRPNCFIKKSNRKIFIFGIVISLIFITYLVFFLEYSEWINWIVFKMILIGILMIVSYFENDKIPSLRIFKYSFFIYVIHTPLISIINTLINHIIGDNALSLGLAIVLQVILLVVLCSICIAFAVVVKRFLPSKLYSALSGGRN